MALSGRLGTKLVRPVWQPWFCLGLGRPGWFHFVLRFCLGPRAFVGSGIMNRTGIWLKWNAFPQGIQHLMKVGSVSNENVRSMVLLRRVWVRLRTVGTRQNSHLFRSRTSNRSRIMNRSRTIGCTNLVGTASALKL